MRIETQDPIFRVAVDVGGTFTDVCVMNEGTGAIEIYKGRTTAAPLRGVLEAFEQAGIGGAQVGLFYHATTIATNALITRQFPRAAMVTTLGFRDVTEIRRGTKEDIWDPYADNARPYIARRDRLEVLERVDASGKVILELDEERARVVARELASRDIKSVAVCFINAYANGSNEERMRDILLQELNDPFISMSSEVLPEIFEHERFSTTIVNTVVGPLISSYVEALDTRLRDKGFVGDLMLMHSGGGVMSPASAARFGGRLAASGLAAGAVAGNYIADLVGTKSALSFDMGGTSTDIAVTIDHELHMTSHWSVEYGYPICFPSVDVYTIGAGGGSIGWIDAGGSLRSGPQSAGAVPGPAAYANGGEEPTVTDANLVLGRLSADLLGGAMRLDVDLATHAIENRIARPLGMSVVDAARALISITNANMVDALRLMSVRRGLDPREFALIAFGGAGGLHATALARELDIPEVIIPWHPGITGAFGCLVVDIRHDASSTFFSPADSAAETPLRARIEALRLEVETRLEAESVPRHSRRFQAVVALRYVGQWRTVGVHYDDGDTVDSLVARFHERYKHEHNYQQPGRPVEITSVTLTGIGSTPRPAVAAVEPDGRQPPSGSRSVYFDDDFPQRAALYRRNMLGAGAAVAGPAVIEQLDTTVLVPPGACARVDSHGLIHIEMGQA